MKTYVDEIYLFAILVITACAVYWTKGDTQVTLAVIGMNATAIAFYKWMNSKNGE